MDIKSVIQSASDKINIMVQRIHPAFSADIASIVVAFTIPIKQSIKLDYDMVVGPHELLVIECSSKNDRKCVHKFFELQGVFGKRSLQLGCFGIFRWFHIKRCDECGHKCRFKGYNTTTVCQECNSIERLRYEDEDYMTIMQTSNCVVVGEYMKVYRHPTYAKAPFPPSTTVQSVLDRAVRVMDIANMFLVPAPKCTLSPGQLKHHIYRQLIRHEFSTPVAVASSLSTTGYKSIERTLLRMLNVSCVQHTILQYSRNPKQRMIHRY